MTYYDPVSTVKYNVFGANQWVSYDDEQSFTDKKAFLTSRCLGGLMIWSIDFDEGAGGRLPGDSGNDKDDLGTGLDSHRQTLRRELRHNALGEVLLRLR